MQISAGRGALRLIHSRLGFVSVTALLCLSGSPKAGAEQASQTQSGSVALPTVQVDPARRARPKRAKAAPTKKAAKRPPAPPAQTQPVTPPASTNYQVGESGTGRIATPLVNTPQSITVVPQQLIREQASTTVMDALRNVPGITFRAGEGGNQGDVPYIRGFDARNDIFRDGVRDPGWYTRDSFAIESVEVLKGPSSFIFGRGSTGGVINLITKTPIWGQDYFEGTLTAHTGPGVRSVIDTNKQLGENVAGRIQVMGQRYDIPDRDGVEENRWGVAPSLAFKLGERTRATVSYIYQKDDSIPDRGIPFLPASFGTPRLPAPSPRGAWYGVLTKPLADVEDTEAHIATGRIVHELTNDIKITNTSRYVNVDRLNRATLPNNFNPPVGTNFATFMYRPGRQHTEVSNELIANNTDLNAKFTTWGLQHNLVAGIDFAHEERSQATRAYTANSADATNFSNPNPYRNPGTFGPLGVATLSNADSLGVYIADQIKITQYFELLGGVRYDKFDASSGSTTILQREDRLGSYRVGGVFHPVQNASLYVMHGTSFNPTAEFLTISAANADLDPEKNETTEVGLKVDILNRRVSLTAALFRTDKTNARVPDPDNVSVNVLGGLTRIEGIELGAVGRVTDEWQVFAGYTHLNSRIVTNTTESLIGKTLLNTPDNAFSLWTTYDLTPKWTVGGGAFYVDEVFGNADNTTVVPSYWRFDAVLSYKVNANITAQFNLYNLTNEYYFAQVYNNWAVPGQGRSAALTIRGRW